MRGAAIACYASGRPTGHRSRRSCWSSHAARWKPIRSRACARPWCSAQRPSNTLQVSVAEMCVGPGLVAARYPLRALAKLLGQRRHGGSGRGARPSQRRRTGDRPQHYAIEFRGRRVGSGPLSTPALVAHARFTYLPPEAAPALRRWGRPVALVLLHVLLAAAGAQRLATVLRGDFADSTMTLSGHAV